MTLKETLFDFFGRYFAYTIIHEHEIKSVFNNITSYKYTTPTAYIYFRSVLTNSCFLERRNKITYGFNWKKIFQEFPELQIKQIEFLKKQKKKVKK